MKNRLLSLIAGLLLLSPSVHADQLLGPGYRASSVAGPYFRASAGPILLGLAGACPTNQFGRGASTTTGVPICTQPSFSNLAGQIASAQIPSGITIDAINLTGIPTTPGFTGYLYANGGAGWTASANIPVGALPSLSSYLDAAFGTTRGSVLYRGASGWASLPPGAAGTVFSSNGAGLDPSYQVVAGGGTGSGTGNVSSSGTIVSGNLPQFANTAGTAITDSGYAPAYFLNAANLSSGTLPAGRMPALTGDCTTTAGAVATTCAPFARTATVNTFALAQTFSASPIFTTLAGYIKGAGAGAATASATVPTSDLSGTLLAAQAPAFTGGDCISSAGSLSITCTPFARTASANTFAAAQTFTVAPIFTALTGYVKGAGTGAATASATVPVGDLSGTVGIAQGGTGQTTASAARTALLAAASGANSDITSLTGLTTALSIGQGGTGATTVSAARSGLGAAASGSNSDITAISGLTTALSLAQGGTGATSASAARANLLAAASGANGDITSITGLTTALSLAQGGTGGTTAATARSGIGAAAAGANSDITALSGLTTPLSIAQGGTGGATASAARTALGAAAAGANTDITSVGAVTGVTATAGDNTTKLATTAFTTAAIAAGGGGGGGGTAVITGASAKSANYTVLQTDAGKVLQLTGSPVVTLPAGLTANTFLWVSKNDGTLTTAALTPASGTIDGRSSINVYQEKFMIWTDGTNWFSQDRQRGWVTLGQGSVTGGATTTTPSITIGFGDPEMSEVECKFDNLVLSTSSTPNVRVVKSGSVVTGSTYVTSALYNSSPTDAAASNSTTINAVSFAPGTVNVGPYYGTLNFRDIQSTTPARQAASYTAGYAASFITGQFYENTASALQGFAFVAGTGNVTTANYTLKGYRG